MATLANLSNPEGGDDPFQMEEAVTFAFTNDGIRILTRDGDAYEALEMVTDTYLKEYELGIGIITTGWASPLNADGDVDGAPSQHPLRRRVRLVSLRGHKEADGFISPFSSDEPDDLIYRRKWHRLSRQRPYDSQSLSWSSRQN